MNDKRQQLMTELLQMQTEHKHQDILTITAFMDLAELEAHVMRYRNHKQQVDTVKKTVRAYNQARRNLC